MTLPLRWTEQAVAQLGAIAEHLATTSPVYAEQVVDQIVHRLEQARQFPESGRMVPEYERPEIRELIEPPYRVLYRTGPEAIEVVAILHSRQNLGERR